MSELTLESLGFSERRSNHYGLWAPIYMEPMVGSGERLCVGIVTADADRSIVYPVPTLERLVCIYGNEVEAFVLASRLALSATERHVAQYGISALEGWGGPVEGLTFGLIRSGAGSDLEDIARTGLMLCASLVNQLSEEDEDEQVAANADGFSGRLEYLVKNAVIARRPDLQRAFGKSFSASDLARPARIGFAGTRLVANFGLIVPGKLSSLVSTAKAKLWDLKQLKSGALSGFFNDGDGLAYELLVHRTRDDDPQFTERQIRGMKAAVLELEEEADKVDIRCRPMDSPMAIAEFVLEKEAA